MRQHVIALVDCDCFFVSCERKDTPDLQGKPVCVMTGGGSKGIIVSRSKEAKALGIKMGQPYFQVKPNFPTAICIPARHHRYTEISKEVMDTIKAFSPDVEVTSVDEAFIDLTSLNKVYHSTYTTLSKISGRRFGIRSEFPFPSVWELPKLWQNWRAIRQKVTTGYL